MSLVNTAAGGKISGLLALTFETDVSLPEGTPVHVSDDYEVERADGTKIVVGTVDVANVARSGGAYPTYVTPGIVTVEARGFSVRTYTATETITAGEGVKANATGIEGGATPDDAGYLGVALIGGDAEDSIDVLNQ